MEHKTWLWKRKSTEKTITANEKSDLTLAGIEQEKEKALELERSLEDLKEQLSSARMESDAKDNLLTKQVKVAEEALAGWDKAEKEADFIKQELGHTLLQKAAAEARIVSIDSALKECTQQLHTSKEEYQHTIQLSHIKISQEQEKTLALAKRLAQTNDRVATLAAEIGNLRRILEAKEKLIEDLTLSKSRIEESLTDRVARLDSFEKDNASLEYEVCMLRRELEIRNQDTDFHLKSADAAHKQHLESIKKIEKLESECQKLRVMVRKRLPGPAAIAKMRSEVDILGNGYDTSNKKVSSLIERLHAVEDENKTLKEALVKRNDEIQSSRVMFARTASKLSQAETQLEEFSKGQISPLWNDLPLASIPEDDGNEDTVSCAESWASALISELENFRNGKPTTPSSTTGVSELSLMDDFIEMEKLAVVCVHKKLENSNITSPNSKKFDLEVNSLDSIGKEIVPVYSLSSGTIKQPFQLDLEKPICKMIELIEGIIQKSFSNISDRQILDGKDDTIDELKSFSPSGHAAKIFLWETSALISVLQHFVVVCNDLLHGKTEFRKFTYEVASTLDWIINHCFSLQDVSTMGETVKKIFNRDDLQSDNESHRVESKLNDENGKMRPDIVNIESKENDSGERMTSLSTQLKESSERISNLEAELVAVKNSKRSVEDEIESQKLIVEDLITQLTVANAELNEARKKFLSLEVELEDKRNCCEELETTCLDLQLQLESASAKETIYGDGQAEKQLKTEWEISAASEKLAECQSTILELGKQLKALAAPKDAPLFDKVISPRISRRPQLLDQMQADDESRSEELKSPKTKEIICTEVKATNPNAGLLYGKKLRADMSIAANDENIDQPSPMKSSSFSYKSNELNKNVSGTDVGKLVIVPNRQKVSASFLRKLLLRRKGSNKKQALLVGT